MKTKQIRRGEIWWVLANASAVGSEIQKTRPALVISADHVNREKTRVTILPLTSNLRYVHTSEVAITVEGRRSKVLVDQVLAADKSRFTSRLGVVSESDLAAVEYVLREHFEL